MNEAAELHIPLAAIVWPVAAILAIGLSGVIIGRVFRYTGKSGEVSEGEQRTGIVIGKIENLLVVIFVALNDFTALALIFAAKGIIRARDDKHASYYLLGTLANFAWSLLVALSARGLLLAFG